MTFDQRFPERRVLITGANSGFGEAIALLFARRGWRVAVTGRRPDAVRTAAQKVRAAGAREVLELTIDVTVPEHFTAAVTEVESRWGGLDVLINNAGILDSGKLQDLTLERWRRAIDINLFGVIHGCNAFLPMMMRQESGYVCNVASSAGLFALPEMANYSVSKAGVIALSETMRAELTPCNIGVTVACPAAFSSALVDNARAVDAGIEDSSVTLRSLTEDLKAGRHTSETVAAHCLRAMEKGRLFAIAHPEMHLLRLFKRMFPEWSYTLFGWMYANKVWRFRQ
jgi:NAD(P)-dependent dehydrogenase (short-subunit alcohol dehydrogenase family)